MRYVQLRAFHHVAVTGGFSKAAEALLLTQPAISDQVRKLEEDYDILLFHRRKKQVTLTEPGRRLLEITRRMFDTELMAQELLSESRVFRTGTLRIVADAAHHLAQILTRFRGLHPRIKVILRTGNTESVVSSLISHEADIGVVGEIPVLGDFEIVKLNSSPIVAFVSASHPLALEKTLSLEQLSCEPLVLRERGSKTRQKLEDWAAREGYELSPAIEAEGREAVREIVAGGAGVGFVSMAEYGEDSRLVQISLAGPEMLMDEALICLRERSGGKLVKTFMELARSISMVR